MPNLSEIISLKVFLTGLLVALLALYALKKSGMLTSWVDPGLLPWFQVCFTFGCLLVLGYLPFTQICYFSISTFLLIAAQKIKVKRVKVINESLVEDFSYFLFFLAVANNAFLILTKGFIFTANEINDAKLYYYQNFGIFRRVNEIAVPILSLVAFKFWRTGKRITAFIYFAVACFCLITLGSKSGLITFVFLYGCHYRFNTTQERQIIKQNKGKFFIGGLLMVLSSFAMFYFIFGEYFMEAFFFRTIGYADGPIFFFFSNMQDKIFYDPTYMFFNLFDALRIPQPTNFPPLGPVINYYSFGIDNDLIGPNPQIFVESSVMFHSLAFLYYIFVYLTLFICRKIAASPYSFYFLTVFATTLFIDSTYAFYQVFDFMVLGVLITIFWAGKILWGSLVYKIPLFRLAK